MKCSTVVFRVITRGMIVCACVYVFTSNGVLFWKKPGSLVREVKAASAVASGSSGVSITAASGQIDRVVCDCRYTRTTCLD